MKRKTSPWNKLLLLVIGTLLFMLIGSIFTIVVSLIIEPNSVWSLRLIQLISIVLLFIIPAFALTRMIDGKVIKPLSLSTKPKLGYLFVITILIILVQPIIFELAEWNSTLELPKSMSAIQEWMRNSEIQAEESLKLLLGGDAIINYIVNILLISVMAGFGEELFFRGLLQNKLSSITTSPIASALLVAILFSALHFQFFGFFPRALLGALFGILLIYSGSLWYSIYAHSLHNAIGVTTYYLVKREVVEENQLETLVSDNPIILIISISSILIILLSIYRCNKQKRTLEL